MYYPREDESSHKQFYLQSIKKYGLSDSRSLHWNSYKTQEVRFDALLQIGSLNNKTILDLGCGTGDLYGYLLRRKISPLEYVGVDFLEHFTKEARKKYPNIKWICDDFLNISSSVKYDYILCNGALNIKRTNNLAFFKIFIEKFLPMCRIALGITLLKYADGYINNPMIYNYTPSEVRTILNKANLIYEIREGYIDNDFTVIIEAR